VNDNKKIGADVLIDVAGTDATAAYEDVGHSEDASEILETYLIVRRLNKTVLGGNDYLFRE
jgi:cytochrome b involved in lipid metabolism